MDIFFQTFPDREVTIVVVFLCDDGKHNVFVNFSDLYSVYFFVFFLFCLHAILFHLLLYNLSYNCVLIDANWFSNNAFFILK